MGQPARILLSESARWLMRPLIAKSTSTFARDPRAALAALHRSLGPADRAVLDDPAKLDELIAHFREAYCKGRVARSKKPI